jgi:hypothetical protein
MRRAEAVYSPLFISFATRVHCFRSAALSWLRQSVSLFFSLARIVGLHAASCASCDGAAVLRCVPRTVCYLCMAFARGRTAADVPLNSTLEQAA